MLQLDLNKMLFSDPFLEECPKWGVLKEVLEEIEEENQRMEAGVEQGAGAVLVAANDDRTCNQIREVRTPHVHR